MMLIKDLLEKALPNLQEAYQIAEDAGINEDHPDYELLQHLGDSLTYCQEALEKINQEEI